MRMPDVMHINTDVTLISTHACEVCQETMSAHPITLADEQGVDHADWLFWEFCPSCANQQCRRHDGLKLDYSGDPFHP